MPSKPLNEAEISEVLSQLPSLRDKALFILGIKSGFRISELLSLTVEDVRGDVITVKRCNMKGRNTSRTVPLHKMAKEVLKEYTQTLPMGVNVKLFPITRQHAWRVLKRAARGIKGNVSTHSMRKSFAMSVYTRSNKDLKATQLALGHKSLNSTGMYLNVDKEAVDNLILTS